MADGQILVAARDLVKQILTSGGFETDITVTNGTITKSIKGLAPVIHYQFDTQGQPINSKKASVTIYAQTLKDAGYPITVNDTLSLLGHRITFIDSTGVSKTYRVKQDYFDNTLGHVTLMLENYAS